MLGKLIVRVYKAEGLASADMNGKSDPFIKMYLVNQFHRTSTQYKTLNPEWNEMFHFDVFDIHNSLDLHFYDEDRHGEDFLGRIMIPLLSINNKKLVWYKLKDKKLQNPAKGRVLIRMDIQWSMVKACIRTFNPLEELNDPPPPMIKKSLMVSNFMRAKTQLMVLFDVFQYIKSCWQWEHKLRSLNAFVLFLVATWYFELWMLPLFLLSILSFNLGIAHSPRARNLLGFDEVKYSTLTDIRCLIASDDSVDDVPGLLKTQASLKETNNNNSGTITNNNTTNATSQEAEDNKSLVEKFIAGKDVVILIQDILGYVASYLERVANTFTFKVPFLSYLMMFCLFVATLLLYFVPLRYIILAWGINKFTKKLRSPNAIDNNELVDFLSRVPDNVQCIKAQNIISY